MGLQSCVVCLEGEQTLKQFAGTNILRRGRTHGTKSWGGDGYFVTFLDDFSKKITGYMHKQKNGILGQFQEYKAYAENQIGKRNKYLRSDNRIEYTNTEFENFLKLKLLVLILNQNYFYKKMNRCLLKKTRCLLIDDHLGKTYWEEAIKTAIYLKTRVKNQQQNNQ